MRKRQAGGRRGRWSNALVWVGGAAVVATAAAVTTLVVVSLFDGHEPAATRPPPPSLNRSLTLLASPDEGAEELAWRLEEGVPVLLLGRSEDADWVWVELPGRMDVAGWLPADAVVNSGDLGVLPAVGDTTPPPETASMPAASGPTETPDLPDLAVEGIFSRDNRLVVAVVNVGNADLTGAVFLAVDGRAPTRIDVADKPLRPGDTLEAVLEREYVQRRASVTIEALPDEGVEEERTENNRVTVVIAPDVPNDLELLSVELELEPVRFAITVRNNSIIPLVGAVTIAVRRTAPKNLLLGRIEAPLDIAAGGTQLYQQRFELAEQSEPLELADVQVILSTDAINDAATSNNVFPR